MARLDVTLAKRSVRDPAGRWVTELYYTVTQAEDIPLEVFVHFVEGSRFAYVALPNDIDEIPVGRVIALELYKGYYREPFAIITVKPEEEVLTQTLIRHQLNSLVAQWAVSGPSPAVETFTVDSK